MNRSSDFKKYSWGYGFIAPFCMLILSVYWIYNTPITADKLKIIVGIIKHQNYFPGCILIEGNDAKFIIRDEADMKRISPILKNSLDIKIWVKESGVNGSKTIKQLALDGKIVLSYNYWKEIITPFIFGIIGLILIPIVVKAKKRQKAGVR